MSFQTSFVDPPCVSHKWSGMLGHSDGVSSPECCVDNVSCLLSHGIPGGVQLVQSQTASVASKSAFLSPIHIMTNSVVNSITGCRLYKLVKPLLMRTYDLKRACIKDKEPLQKAKVTQGYLGSNEKIQGLNCYSASPTCVGWFINPTEYHAVKDYKSAFKERPNMSRLGVACLYREHHESDPGDIDIPFKNTDNHSREPLSEDPSRVWGISHIFEFACSWLKGVLKMMRHPQLWRKYGHFMGLETWMRPRGQYIGWNLWHPL